LEGGATINDFLDGFSTVTREQLVAFLEEAKGRYLGARTFHEPMTDYLTLIEYPDCLPSSN
jgi:hypothetical protein